MDQESFVRSLRELADALLEAQPSAAESAPADLKAYEVGIALGQRLAGARLADELARFRYSGGFDAEIRSNLGTTP
jgi:hypothetical protein